MAKRKKSKKANNSAICSVELTGLILILIGIIGMGFGPIGNFIKEFSMFLAGELWYLVLFTTIILGAYMLFKRKLPNFFTQKLIGFYLVLIILLVIAHFDFLENTSSFKEMMQVTFDNFMNRKSTLTSAASIFESGDSSIVIGGGIIGSLLLGALSSAFAKTGTIIVLVIIGLFAFILLFNITFADIFKKIKGMFKGAEDDDEDDEEEEVKDKKKKKELIKDDDKDMEIIEEKDNRIVVNSIDDLKNIGTQEPVASTVNVTSPVSDDHNPSKDSFNKENEEVENTESYRLPSFSLLNPIKKSKTNNEEQYVKANTEALESVLRDFEINAKVVEVHIGPAITEYELTVQKGTKVNRITNINKEIALAMAAKDVRIQAPIPGKSTIGIEIPNHEIAAVAFREVLEDKDTINQKSENKILMALGKDIMGKCIVSDLTKTPHLLVAGSTGSGKSVCINSIIASILMRYKPNEVKLVLVDPKKVELSNYNGIPHLLCPVVCDPKRASATLQKIVTEMENRYETFSEKEVKNIAGYNEWIEKENKKHPDNKMAKMSYIVVIIDELADLMMVASKEVQDSIMRITQMARAAGIHLIVATQRPSTDIITGVIKNNIPSRIAFAVSSSIDSRTILDSAGAEKLLGRGDMLFAPMGQNVPTRIQGCYISDDEIHNLIEYCKGQATVKYNEVFTSEDLHTQASGSSNSDGGDDDPMYNEIVEFAVQTGKISASLIQRRFRFGYNRAARVIDLLEARGIIGPQNGSKPREVLVKVESDNQEE